MALAFLSYRRDDAAAAAQAIYAQLKVHFGSGQIFMDVNSIAAGEHWPAYVRHSAERATGMLVLVGPRWLQTTDRWARRRIDLPTDWVLQEVRAAMERKIPIIPVILDGVDEIPPPEALPDAINQLFSSQLRRVSRDNWVPDLEILARDCTIQFGLSERLEFRGVTLPRPNPAKAKTSPVHPGLLSRFLARGSGWVPWEDSLPREYPYTRQELRKTFDFGSFIAAVGFMREAAEVFERKRHHPRWSNEWKSVTIGLTTWDAGNRITQIDLDTAGDLDRLYSTYVRNDSLNPQTL